MSRQLQKLAMAMRQYVDAHTHFPAAASTSKDLSWRVALLPHLGERELYKDFRLDEPWDSEHNKKLLTRMPAVFRPVGLKPQQPHTTFYQVFVGNGKERTKPVFDANVAPRMPDIVDGAVNTVLIAEAAKAVPWTQPADLAYTANQPLPALGGGMIEDGLFSFVLVDGEPRWARWTNSVAGSEEEKRFQQWLRAIITRNGEETVDTEAFDD
jgi:hypothetical protein